LFVRFRPLEEARHHPAGDGASHTLLSAPVRPPCLPAAPLHPLYAVVVLCFRAFPRCAHLRLLLFLGHELEVPLADEALGPPLASNSAVHHAFAVESCCPLDQPQLRPDTPLRLSFSI